MTAEEKLKVGLTDEEIEGLLGIEFRNSYSGHVAEYLAVRDAQLKKVVEGLKRSIAAEYYSPEAGCDVVAIPTEDWQALLEEVAK